MRLKLLFVIGLLTSLPACTEFAHYGAIAVEKRRTMNDLQARTTMAATCDISIGAYFRELSDAERRYAALVCGGVVLDMPQNAAPPISRETETTRKTLEPGYSLAPLDWTHPEAI
jgi:hypothetical protein